VGPRDPSGWAGARTGAVGFGVVGSLFVGGIVPVVPAGGVEVGWKLSVDIDDAGVGPPGTAEADGVVCGFGAFCAGGRGVHGRGIVAEAAGDAAVEDDVPGGLVGGRAGLRGEVAGAVGVEFRVVEDGGCVAER
jgi:hypothetical protein